MKRLLIASAVILPAAVSQQILAPDIAAAQSPGTNWSGFHFGFSGGGGTGHSTQTDNYHPPTTTTGPTGATGPTAASGPTGPTGASGPVGASNVLQVAQFSDVVTMPPAGTLVILTP